MGEDRVEEGSLGEGSLRKDAGGRMLGTGRLGCSTFSRNPPSQGLPGRLCSTPADPLLSAHTPALPAP